MNGGSEVQTWAPAGPAGSYYTQLLAKGGAPNYSAVTNALNAADNQTWQNFYNTQLPLINQKASFLGNQSAGIKDLNSAITNIGTAQANAGQAAMLGQYDLAQENALAAARGLGGTTTSKMTPGSGANFANILGGGLGLAGLLGALFGNGQPGGGGGSGALGGLLGSLGKLFGGGQPAATNFFNGPQASDMANYTFLPPYSPGDLTDPGTPNLDAYLANYQPPDLSGLDF